MGILSFGGWERSLSAADHSPKLYFSKSCSGISNSASKFEVCRGDCRRGFVGRRNSGCLRPGCLRLGCTLANSIVGFGFSLHSEQLLVSALTGMLVKDTSFRRSCLVSGFEVSSLCVGTREGIKEV